MTNPLRSTIVPGCELCNTTGGDEVHRTEKYRVVLVDDPDYPGFCRVILNHHVREMSELDAANRTLLMEAVWQVEAALRDVMSPTKVNLASLGNAVPHIHWHVIPRFADDAHFPGPVWAARQREPDARMLAQRRAMVPALCVALCCRLASVTGMRDPEVNPATQKHE
jgi:diadenosine tetraphosphate (Ap4A) HIT family hydrolase